MKRWKTTTWPPVLAFAVLAASHALVPGKVGAQEAAHAALQADVARAAAGILEENYVKPAVGREMAALLRDGADAGAWAGAGSAADFARRLTMELNAIAHDLHLQILPPGDPNASQAGASGGGRQVRRVVPGGDGARGEPSQQRRVRPGGQGAGGGPEAAGGTPLRWAPPLDPALPASFRLGGGETAPPLDALPAGVRSRVERERRQNHHFRSVEILPGNVGYLDLDQFPIMPYAAPTADAAMQFLANVDAFVLDLRSNPGGGEGMNQYLGSFFFADSTHLYSRYYAPDDVTREYWSMPELPPFLLPDVPLYVLVDGRSGSAAENMAFNLKATGRATVVGENTAGAGHSSTRMELPHGYSMVVPIARVFDPRTDDDFEGTGVAPDVAAPSGEALVRAHGLAVERLAEADPARAADLQQAGALFAAQHAGPASPEVLREYEGRYGARRVWVADGRLMLQRTDVDGAPELVLLRTGPDRFVLEALPSARVEFTRSADGAVDAIRVLQPTGRWDEAGRQ